VTSPPRSRKPRSDGLANRERLLAAAREVFAERGLEATLDDVARHAGLGVGTAYRHFPNKQALAHGLFDDRFAEFIAIADASLGEPDAGAAFAAVITYLVRDLHEVKAMRDLLLGPGPSDPPPPNDELKRVLDAVLLRAQQAGAVRTDISGSDLPGILDMLGAVSERRPDDWERFLDIVLDGLRAR